MIILAIGGIVVGTPGVGSPMCSARENLFGMTVNPALTKKEWCVLTKWPSPLRRGEFLLIARLYTLLISSGSTLEAQWKKTRGLNATWIPPRS